MPKGPLGCWITKKSKSVLGGSPVALTLMTSTGPPGWMVTVPEAVGTQSGTAFSAGERTMANVDGLGPPPLACAGETNPASATPQSTAMRAPDEVHFECVLFFMRTSLPLSADPFGGSDCYVGCEARREGYGQRMKTRRRTKGVPRARFGPGYERKSYGSDFQRHYR